MSWVSEALDRGVTVRRSQHVVGKDPHTGHNITQPGPYVYMYKDEPGVYYDEHGHKVTEGLAKMVGFPTNKLEAARKRKLQMEEVSRKIDEQYQAEVAAMGEEHEVLADRGEWSVIGLPGDRAYIEDHNGNRITMTLPKEVALSMLDLTYPEAGGKLEAKNNPDGKEGEKHGSKAS